MFALDCCNSVIKRFEYDFDDQNLHIINMMSQHCFRGIDTLSGEATVKIIWPLFEKESKFS